jgi:hypothetical protein
VTHACPCCECEDDEPSPLTPEELAERRLLTDAALSDRMRPARDRSEQISRDVAHMNDLAAAYLTGALYDSGPRFEGSQITGLAAWLPKDPPS